ncbi:MAG TPA: NIPSNAP family protein [Sphingomicrobium sp.]|nr:NIPSNAP family protein [Sphingomicrobium sp.]
MSNSILDIRVYKLKPGVAEAFAAHFSEQVEPMLERHQIKVVHFGQSLIDPDGFCLIRRFGSIEERDAQLSGFYGSEEWLENHDDPVMAMIDSYNVCVVDGELAQQGFDRIP